MNFVSQIKSFKYQKILHLSFVAVILLVISCGSQKSLPEDTASFEKLMWSKNSGTVVINKKMLKINL